MTVAKNFYYEQWGIPKETNPPLVLKSSKVSPLNSGGGMGDQVHGGALAHFSELPTSMSSYCKRKRRKGSTTSTASEQTCFTICVVYDDNPSDSRAPWDSNGVDIDK